MWARTAIIWTKRSHWNTILWSAYVKECLDFSFYVHVWLWIMSNLYAVSVDFVWNTYIDVLLALVKFMVYLKAVNIWQPWKISPWVRNSLHCLHRKVLKFRYISIGCQNKIDKFRWSQWWYICQHNDISFSMQPVNYLDDKWMGTYTAIT